MLNKLTKTLQIGKNRCQVHIFGQLPKLYEGLSRSIPYKICLIYVFFLNYFGFVETVFWGFSYDQNRLYLSLVRCHTILDAFNTKF